MNKISATNNRQNKETNNNAMHTLRPPVELHKPGGAPIDGRAAGGQRGALVSAQRLKQREAFQRAHIAAALDQVAVAAAQDGRAEQVPAAGL
jgi:hypothetical protein